jgi:hypothetical protein
MNKMAVQFLNDNGFDGLVNASCDCACNKENLAPCGQPNMMNCVAAYKTSSPQLGLMDDCDEYYSPDIADKVK